MLAIHAEHKARTGHDAFNRTTLQVTSCDVCLFLDAEKRDQDKAEEQSYCTCDDWARGRRDAACPVHRDN